MRAAVRANCHRDGVVAGVGDRIARHADLKRRADRPQCPREQPGGCYRVTVVGRDEPGERRVREDVGEGVGGGRGGCRFGH